MIGFAKAETPLLEKPLEGPVYFRSAPENKSGLPDIVAVLKGQIEIDLDGKIKTIFQKLHGEKVPRITTTFGAVPDAPVSKFTLSLDGGNKGLLQNSANLCKPRCASTSRWPARTARRSKKTHCWHSLRSKSAKRKRRADTTGGLAADRAPDSTSSAPSLPHSAAGSGGEVRPAIGKCQAQQGSQRSKRLRNATAENSEWPHARHAKRSTCGFIPKPAIGPAPITI